MDFANVEQNLRESFRAIAADRPSGENRELPGVSIASAGVVFEMFNAAFLSAPVTSEKELEQRILLPSVHFSARGLEWAYWVCEDWLDSKTRRRARRLFEKHGLRHSVDLPGMVAETVLPPVNPLPPLEMRRVDGPATRDAFCFIGSLCFNVPLVWFREVFESEGVFGRFAAFVGYVDGEPVSTAATVIGGGAVGVYNVATVPGSRRRGYGEAAMRHALHVAREERGLERSVLQSTPSGYKLYERMGYRTVTRVSVYST